jgi:hypothetical protein
MCGLGMSEIVIEINPNMGSLFYCLCITGLRGARDLMA